MLPLYDMLAKAQDGQAMETVARQFGLSAAKAQEAVEALLPAFSQGLKRNASEPLGVGAFLSALSTGRHAEYYRNPQAAFTQSGLGEGNGILAHLFGSPEVSRAVAAQAEQATGIAQETLKQMLPALAAMIMGGLFQQSTAPSAAKPNPMQEMMERMMGQGARATPPRPEAPQPGENAFDNPFLEALNGMFGGKGGEVSAGAAGANPFATMFEEMMGGASRREAAPNPSGRARSTYDDLFGQMFETGRRTRGDYEESMAEVFEAFARKHDGGGRA